MAMDQDEMKKDDIPLEEETVEETAEGEIVQEDTAGEPEDGADAGETQEEDDRTGDTAEGEDAEEAEADVTEKEESEADAENEGKKSFFKKKEKKDKKDVMIEELTDKVRRQMAEFDNFRKRTEKEKSSMYEIGVKSVLEKILPVVDNFERGLVAVPEEQKEDPFPAGMDKTYRQLMTILEEIGVTPIDAIGQEFDPNMHNAVMHVEDETLGENVVAEEFLKGYTYRGSVVRYSMVKVAN